MKETVKISRTAGYLEKMFRVLNQHYFDSFIEEPIITIQSTPKAYGHVTVSKAWHKQNGEQRHELNIGAGTIDRPIESVVSTLLHEMIHLYNMQIGVQDCSRGGTYHNKCFRDAAMERDLDISYDPRIGWSITAPTEALIDFIIKEGWTDIRMGRLEGSAARGIGGGAGAAGTPTTPKPSSSRKYTCPCCKNSVRATKAVNIICGDCLEQMVLAI